MNKQEKEEFKRIDKTVTQTMKQTAKRLACKVISFYIYEIIEQYFAVGFYYTTVVDRKTILTFRMDIKPYNYDDIFWEVFDIKDNSKQSDSLRATGAFTAPSVQIKENKYIISEITSIESICIEAMNDFKNESREFVKMISLEYENFDLFVLDQSSKLNYTLFDMLANISLQRYEDAERIAQAELDQGNGGRKANRGIYINEYIVKYCKNRTD